MNRVIEIVVVQSNEVASSVHMELEGLKRGLRHLAGRGMKDCNPCTALHYNENAEIRR